MNVFEKIIEKLEELQEENTCGYCRYRKKCNEVQEKVSVATDLCGATMKALAIEIVKEVAEEHNNGWIPLSSGKRPKDNQFILFTVKLERGGKLETFYNTKYGFYDELRDKFVISDGSVNTMPFGEVTAWQPLPESYREEVKEDE